MKKLANSSCQGSYLAKDYPKLYLIKIVKFHRVPMSIISDCGTQFTSKFLKSFQKGIGTHVKLSITFHPQIDGQAERTIQILKDMLRVCVVDFKGLIFLIRIVITQVFIWLDLRHYMVGGVHLL